MRSRTFELWLVYAWFCARPHDQRDLTLLKNVRQLKQKLMISICGINILQLLTMKRNENEITSENSVKLLWGIIDEQIHKKFILKSQKIKLLKLWEFFIGSVVYLISRTWLQKVSFFFILSYINYVNIAWASAFRTKLKGILKKQKDTARIIFFGNRFDHMRRLLKEITALNFYHINIIQTMKPMYKINMKQIREYSFFNFVR